MICSEYSSRVLACTSVITYDVTEVIHIMLLSSSMRRSGEVLMKALVLIRVGADRRRVVELCSGPQLPQSLTWAGAESRTNTGFLRRAQDDVSVWCACGVVCVWISHGEGQPRARLVRKSFGREDLTGNDLGVQGEDLFPYRARVLAWEGGTPGESVFAGFLDFVLDVANRLKG